MPFIPDFDPDDTAALRYWVAGPTMPEALVWLQEALELDYGATPVAKDAQRALELYGELTALMGKLAPVSMAYDRDLSNDVDPGRGDSHTAAAVDKVGKSRP